MLQFSFLLTVDTSASKEEPARCTSERWLCFRLSFLTWLVRVISFDLLVPPRGELVVSSLSPVSEGKHGSHLTAEKSARTHPLCYNSFSMAWKPKHDAAGSEGSGKHPPSRRCKPGVKSFHRWVYFKDNILLSSRVFLPESRRNEDMKQQGRRVVQRINRNNNIKMSNGKFKQNIRGNINHGASLSSARLWSAKHSPTWQKRQSWPALKTAGIDQKAAFWVIQ